MTRHNLNKERHRFLTICVILTVPICVLVSIISASEDNFPVKHYREFQVIHDFDEHGKLIYKGTVLLPRDNALIERLKQINKMQCTTGDVSPELVINVIRETDLSLIVHKALILLCKFPKISDKSMNELHSLAYSSSQEIQTALPYTLAFYKNPSSLFPLIFLANSSDGRVSNEAKLALNYFGIEVLSILPLIQWNFTPLYGRWDRFLLLKVLMHYEFILFVAAGHNIFFPSRSVTNPRGSPQWGVYGNDVDKLPNLEDLTNPNLEFPR